ncbi:MULTISPECIES: hypothetical protein [unclassified Nocardioides]|nr:hypothetical protein [Nocardioides sp. Arc9.136]WKN48162.1 hypothetical protein OSR43_19295 [Nocardioides sp. Arc9.136]
MRVLLYLLAAFLVVSGALWWVAGSGVFGPILAGLGVALVIVVVQNTRRG